MARFPLHAVAIAAVLAPTACGKVVAPGGETVDAAHVDSAPPDAEHLSKPVAAITSIGVAGTQAQCTTATAATGPGSIEYVASWTVNGFPFTTTTTTALAGDTVPGTATHTGSNFECTLFATNGTETTVADPVSVTFKPRLAFAIERLSQMLETIDLDSFAVTPIAKVDADFQFGDIAWDATNQILYMVNGLGGSASTAKSLFTIDTTTGHATQIGVHGVTNVFGLSFDNQNRLFAGASNGTNSLSLVNTTSGAFTTLGGTFDSDALTFDTKRSLMMTITGGGGQMSTVNLTNGSTTQVSSDGFVNDCGMTYDPLTDFIWLADDSGSVYRYDPQSGYSRVQVKTFPTSGSDAQLIDGLAIILPPP